MSKNGRNVFALLAVLLPMVLFHVAALGAPQFFVECEFDINHIVVKCSDDECLFLRRVDEGALPSSIQGRAIAGDRGASTLRLYFGGDGATKWTIEESWYVATNAGANLQPNVSDSVGSRCVENIQAALKALKYYDGPLDGLAGPATAEALRAFQRTEELVVTGSVDSGTRFALTQRLYAGSIDVPEMLALGAKVLDPCEDPTRLSEMSAAVSGAVLTRIDGVFEGWNLDARFYLRNGQIWQQVSNICTPRLTNGPQVLIVHKGGLSRMYVADMASPVSVRRLQ